MFETLEQLKAANSKVVGVKQVQKAVQRGEAAAVFMADDAEPHVLRELQQFCIEHSIPVVRVPTMSELGRAAGIQVGSATVAVLKA